MSWKQLLLKKALIGRIPYADNLRKVKRRIFGYPPNVDALLLTIRSYERIKLAIEKLGIQIEGATVLEIGSGWFPIIPILLAKHGANKVLMSDLNAHMDGVTFKETAIYLKKNFLMMFIFKPFLTFPCCQSNF